MPLPNFVIAGERRSGTTSLARWMEAHPDIFLHPALDMAYFLENEIVGRTQWLDGELDPATWDVTHSPEDYAALFTDGAGKQAIGEKSADYLFWRPAHERLARFLPEAKFIFTLRNPVERAYSHYWHEVGKKRETLSFEEALAAEPERIKNSAWARDHLSYQSRGFYEESLCDFFRHVPRERVLITTVEGNAAQPVAQLQCVYRFLGVDESKGLEAAGSKHNANIVMLPKAWSRNPIVAPLAAAYGKATKLVAGRLAKNKEERKRMMRSMGSAFAQSATETPMAPETRRRLEAEFAPHIAALGQMLGREFPEWQS